VMQSACRDQGGVSSCSSAFRCLFFVQLLDLEFYAPSRQSGYRALMRTNDGLCCGIQVFARVPVQCVLLCIYELDNRISAP
jgi:hypothetical protein